MLGRLRDFAIIAALAVAFNVVLSGSWLYGAVVAVVELLFLGLIMLLSLYVRP